MVIAMMLRFIHSVITSHEQRFGPFKLRGVNMQVTAAASLYHLIATHDDISENDLDWATHNLLETLLKPLGLGSRPVDCPTDQMSFLWAFLSRNHYRIAKDLSSLMAGCKFGFRCIKIHCARVQAQNRLPGASFYDRDLIYDGSEIQSDEDEDEGEDEGGDENPEQVENPSINVYKLDLDTLLAKLQDISPEGVYYYDYLLFSGLIQVYRYYG